MELSEGVHRWRFCLDKVPFILSATLRSDGEVHTFSLNNYSVLSRRMQVSHVQGELATDRSTAAGAVGATAAQPPSHLDSSIVQGHLIRGTIGPKPRRILMV
jgi:hypothetical protein